MNWDLALRSCSVVFERLLGFWANERKKVKLLSHVQHFATPWTIHQASPSMEFSRQEYWSELLFPSPGDLPDPGIKPGSPTLQADAFLYKMWWELADSIIILFCIFFLQSSLNLLQYYFCLMFWLVGHNPRGILVPQLGVEPELPALEGRVLTTGPPGKSLSLASSCTSSSRWEDSGHMSFVCKVLNPPSADPSGPGRSDFFYKFNPVSYRLHQLELKEPKAVTCRNQCPYWSCICWRSKLPYSSVPLLLCSGDAVNETALTLALMRFII